MSGALQLNVFQWIRDGVRRAVLLGVSDAVEQLGTAPQGDELCQQLQRVLDDEPGRIGGGAPSRTGRSKRLGRSLRDIDAGDSR